MVTVSMDEAKRAQVIARIATLYSARCASWLSSALRTQAASLQKKNSSLFEGEIEKLGSSTRDMWEDDEPCKHGIVVRMYLQ